MAHSVDFLNWVADRLVFVHGDDPRVDFVLRLRRMAAEAQLHDPPRSDAPYAFWLGKDG